MFNMVDDDKENSEIIVAAESVYSLVDIIWMKSVESDAQVECASCFSNHKIWFNICKGVGASREFFQQVIAGLFPIDLDYI